VASEENAPPGPTFAATTEPVYGRRRALVVVVVWLALCAVAFAAGRVRLAPTSGLYDHLPAVHRPDPALLWLFVTLSPGAGAQAAAVVESSLVEAFADEIVPQAPAEADLAAFAYAHRLYFATDEALAALDARTRPKARAAAADDLYAMLGAPVFGAIADEIRADPIGLGDALPAPTPVIGSIRDVTWTRTGNLAAGGGRHLLLRLSTAAEVAQVERRARAAVAEVGADVEVLGRRPFEAAATRGLRARALRVLGIAASIWIAASSLAIRRALPVLALVACLSLTAVAVLPWVGALDLWSVPALLFAMAFAAEAALPAWRRTGGGWTSTAVLAAAPAPLLLSDHPALHTVALHFFAAFAVLGVALRFVLPAFLSLLGGAGVWPRRGFRVVPLPLLGVLGTAGLLLAGAAAARGATVVEPDRLARARLAVTKHEAAMAAAFFDPARLVRAVAVGADGPAALARARLDAAALARLVPAQADLVVAPGRLVLDEDEARRARERIERLDLASRMAALREELDRRGFHSGAFGAFLSLADGIGSPPTATAVWDGPVGRWLERVATTEDGATALSSWVLLSPDPAVLPDRLVRDDGRLVRLEGPAVATRRVLRHFDEWLGMTAVASLWLSAIVVWIGTRRLTVAFGATLAGLSAQGAVLGSTALLGLPLGVHMAPVLLLVGAAAVIAAARAMESRLGSGTIAPELPLLSSTFQIGAGLALLAAGQPLWGHQGAALAVGAAAAWGVGLFVAPGLHLVLLRIRRRAP